MLPVVSVRLGRAAVMWRFGSKPLSISVHENPVVVCHTLPLLVPRKMMPDVCSEKPIELT